jgi:hypothetical protein
MVLNCYFRRLITGDTDAELSSSERCVSTFLRQIVH